MATDYPTKPCTQCKQVKALSNFRKRGNGLRSACKQCEGAAHAKYRRRDKGSHLTIEHLPLKDIIRLFKFVEVYSELSWNGSPCWIWEGPTFGDTQYGRLWLNGIPEATHRIMYAWVIGPLPRRVPGKESITPQMDHLCKRTRCCNPLHLELVPPQINNLRSNSVSAINARKTYCSNGHILSRQNAFPSARGRDCKQCATVRHKANRPKYAAYYQAYADDPANKQRMRANSRRHYLKRKAERLCLDLGTP